MPEERRKARTLVRALGRGVLWLTAVIGVAAAANVLGIRMLGGIDAWSHWIRVHAGYFFVWRMLLYTGVAWGWRRLRTRLYQNGTSIEELARMRRVEFASALAILLLEMSNLPFR